MSSTIRGLMIITHFAYKSVVPFTVAVVVGLIALVRWVSPHVVRFVRMYGPPACKVTFVVLSRTPRALWQTVRFILRRYKLSVLSLSVLLVAAWARSKGIVEAEEYWSVVMRVFIATVAVNTILTLFSESAAIGRLFQPVHNALLLHSRVGIRYEKMVNAVTSKWEETQRRFPKSDPQAFEVLSANVNMTVSPDSKDRIKKHLSSGIAARFGVGVEYLSGGAIRTAKSVVAELAVSDPYILCSMLDAMGYFMPVVHLSDPSRENYLKRAVADKDYLYLPALTRSEWTELAKVVEDLLQRKL